MFKTCIALWAITLVWTPVSAEPFPPGNGSTMFNWSLDPEFDLIHSKVTGSFGTPYNPIFRVGSGAGTFGESDRKKLFFQSDWNMFNLTTFLSPDVVMDPVTKWTWTQDHFRRLQEHSPFIRFGRTPTAKTQEHSSSSFTLPVYPQNTDTIDRQDKYFEPGVLPNVQRCATLGDQKICQNAKTT